MRGTSFVAAMRHLKKACDPDGGWLHGDTFLPVVADPLGAGAPLYATQPRGRLHRRQQRVAEVVQTLNRLAFAAPNSSGPLPRRQCVPGSRPTAVQQAALDHVAARVAGLGEPPEDLLDGRALEELHTSRGLYEQEPRNLAPI